jgi:hypothetical protein
MSALPPKAGMVHGGGNVALRQKQTDTPENQAGPFQSVPVMLVECPFCCPIASVIGYPA